MTDPTKNSSRLKILAIVSVILIALPIISFSIDPLLLIVKHVTRIENGSLTYELMEHEMQTALIYSYVFNVTNADEFIAGHDDKLRVQEVGPFVYQQYRRMDDMELDKKEDVLRYTLRSWTQFIPEKSIADPWNVNLTVANIASLAVVSKMSKSSYMAQTAFNMLSNRFKTSPIVKIDAHKLLWGFQEPLMSMSQAFLPWAIHLDKFGILDRLFDQNAKTTMEVDITNANRFQIKKVKNVPGLVTRGYDNPSKRTRCNTFEDTYEGIGYPPGLKQDTPLRMYNEISCRMLDLTYLDSATLDYGPRVLRYQLDNKTYANTPATECLCSSKCIDGLADASPCYYGLSVAMSNAHFLHADPRIYDRIDGIHPDEEKHGSEVLIDSMSGMPLKTKFTLQVNVAMDDVSFSSTFKPFSNMVVPIAYFKIEQSEVSEEFKTLFRFLYQKAPYIIHTLEVIILVIGVGLLTYVIFMKSRERRKAKMNVVYRAQEEAMKPDVLLINVPLEVDFDKLRIID